MPAPAAPDDAPSFLLLEDMFSREDDRFTDELRRHSDAKRLQALALRWRDDARPWARAQVERYLALPLDRPGHATVVKRLLKGAIERGDAARMGALLRALDGLVRRRRKKTWTWDTATRRSVEGESLRAPRDTLPREGGRIFSYRTRHHVRRRAWRWFRGLARTAPGRYVEAIAGALLRYEEADLARPEHLLDCYGLVRACYAGCPALVLGRRYARLAPGATMAALAPAPRFPELWRAKEALAPLTRLAIEARARPVRTFAVTLLERDHAQALAGSADAALLRRLLESEDAEVRALGALVLGASSNAGKFAIRDWVALLEAGDASTQALVVDAFRANVRPERLSAAEAARLACARSAPVATLGREVLAGREPRDEADRRAHVLLAEARCAALAGDLARLALSRIGASGVYDRDGVTAFFDAPLAEARRAALAWLEEEAGAAAAGDPALFARLFENPYPEVRLRLVRLLERLVAPRQAARDARGGDPRAVLWASVLLGIERGSREKLAAVRQLGSEVARDPSHAEELLPVLAVAVRSIRGPERRAGLAAAVAALDARPDLAEAFAMALPELVVAPPVASSTEGAS